MFLFILSWVLQLTPAVAAPLPAQPSSDSITIFGSCWDVATGIDLKTKITATVDGKELVAGESNDDGRFDFSIAASATYLKFEAKGYKTITTPVHTHGKSTKGDRFGIHFKMIAIDSQQITKSYNTLLKEKSGGDVSTDDDVAKSHFQILDAYMGKPLTAKICLTFTRTGRTYCLDTDSSSSPTASFVGELDKIDLKITAEGFQDYEGALKTGQTKSGEIFYQIKLQKVVHPIIAIDFHAPDSLQIEYRLTGNGSSYLPYAKGKPWKNFTHETGLGEQTIVARLAGNGTILGRESYIIMPGLNFKSMHVNGPVTKQVADTIAKTPESRPVSFEKRTLYFNQSSYALNTNTKLTLDSISEFLLKQRNAKAHLTGHTDNVGRRDLNVALSEYRARVVAHYLQNQGVPKQQIVYNWKGPDAPVAANDTEANKVRNRRVDVRVVGN